MANIQIAILNQSSTVSDPDIAAAVSPLQKQIADDFAPIWGTNADLTFLTKGSIVPPASWQLILLDDADQGDSLGYHDLTAAGLPLMKVFAKSAAQDSVSWTSVASHELLEALADPFTDSAVYIQNDEHTGRLWPVEICDPVEGDVYQIDGTEVSNFVTPQWFMPEPPASTVFDFLGFVAKPFGVRNTGYMEYMDIDTRNGWQQV